MPFDFLLDTYDSERLKTLSVWTQFAEADLEIRLEPRARTPREHMVHQCTSEEGWFRTMLGLTSPGPVLPDTERRRDFVRHYARVSTERLAWLRERPADWWPAESRFFEVPRSHAWILTRRMTHSAHHRGQLVAYLRIMQRALYSTYGPTADTGGLPANGGRVLYPYASLGELLGAQDTLVESPPLPGPGFAAPTERPAPGPPAQRV